MELIIKQINGRFNNYTEVYAPKGYCFYDKDNEDMNYLTSITTPIMDTGTLKSKFVLVEGNADLLNDELMKQREEKEHIGE